MTRNIIISIILILSAGMLSGQEDTRYDSDLNLPFNQKAGDVNPQTGGISLSAADVSLPGRAGMNFSFGRIWNLNQANVFNMYYDYYERTDRLDSQTPERLHHLGVGWSSRSRW